MPFRAGKGRKGTLPQKLFLNPFFSALNLTHEIYGRVNSIIPYPPGMGIKMIKTA